MRPARSSALSLLGYVILWESTPVFLFEVIYL